jgi:hypothetical protein
VHEERRTCLKFLYAGKQVFRLQIKEDKHGVGIGCDLGLLSAAADAIILAPVTEKHEEGANAWVILPGKVDERRVQHRHLERNVYW